MGIGPSRRELHTTPRINNIDSDDGNSSLCSVCTLPIFTTPFISHQTDNAKFLIHQQCVDGLPDELIGHALHPRGPLILRDNYNSSTTNNCDNCNIKCGSKFYACSDNSCSFRLDLLCALQIKISHRSHHHELMVVNPGSSIISCGACGTQHLGSSSHLSYLCSPCGFWIHPECASLPNAITLLPQKAKGHHHSLFLTYHFFQHGSSNQFTCGICERVVCNGGVYFCTKCHYYAHIKCATSDPTCFKSVRIRDAKFAGLLHFPLANEDTNVVRHIMEYTTSSSSDESHGKVIQETPHQHPLIFHDKDDQKIDEDGDDDEHPGKYSSRVCNACVKRIDSPPFYSCSHCPDFLLHSFCANLPRKIDHPIHPDHPLFLFPKAPRSDISSYYDCRGCKLRCNGFAYSCNTCDDFSMDVACALLPPAITHESHNKTHILYMSPKTLMDIGLCNSCNYDLLGICYECNTCRDFALDAKCVVLPNTIRHKFDEHPLTLTTTNISGKICEICEELIIHPRGVWHYSCSQCEQSFHCECIPLSSRIKLGGSIRVNTHGCPLKLILQSMVHGYRCGFCREVIVSTPMFATIEPPAYECSKCYYRMHKKCAEQCLSVPE